MSRFTFHFPRPEHDTGEITLDVLPEREKDVGESLFKLGVVADFAESIDPE